MLFLVAASLWLQPQASPPAPPRDLSGIVGPLLVEADLPALGCALVTSAGLEGVGAVGLRAWGGSIEVTTDDQWHIGSCTKALTATLVARLVERGVLRWETTLGEVFGGVVTEMDAAWRDVPITWLLCHRSGASLNFEAELWKRMEARGGSTRAQRRLFVEQGLLGAPEVRPNSATLYSNAGYLLAAAMIEERADRSFEDLVQREVFDALGMSRTGFGAPGTVERLDQPLGHTRGKDGWSPVPLGPLADNPPAAGPAGSVHTTLADWARFACAHLRGERGDESYLKRESWSRLHAPLEGSSYSPGWAVSAADWAGGTLLGHVGSNQHWVAEISLAPRLDLAVLVVTNVGDDAAEQPFRRLLEALVADHMAHTK